MLFRGKEIDNVAQSDLIALIENKVSENRSIEYKKELFGNTDRDKKEFLADVSSFANSVGGHLLIGISEKGGLPQEIKGVEVSNIDDSKQRIENIIRDGIEPRITGIKVKDFLLENEHYVIVLQIPRGWTMPHRVTYKGHDKFYSRNSAGKYPLDVSELRSAFALSESVKNRIENFRLERISNIISGNTPVPLTKFPKIVLHIISLGTFSSRTQIDLAENASNITDHLRPMNVSGFDYRYNFDGILTNNNSNTDALSTSYVQLFRDGSLEAVESAILEPFDGKNIPSIQLEGKLIKRIPEYLNAQKKVGIDPPLIVFVTLLGVKDYRLEKKLYSKPRNNNIDRENLLLPGQLIDEYDVNAGEILKPIFDSIWNAAGYPRSLNYNKDGSLGEQLKRFLRER